MTTRVASDLSEHLPQCRFIAGFGRCAMFVRAVVAACRRHTLSRLQCDRLKVGEISFQIVAFANQNNVAWMHVAVRHANGILRSVVVGQLLSCRLGLLVVHAPRAQQVAQHGVAVIVAKLAQRTADIGLVQDRQRLANVTLDDFHDLLTMLP